MKFLDLFKGGRGIATTLGLFLYLFIKILIQNFSPLESIPLCIFLVTSGLLILLATHGKGDLFTFFLFPCIGLYMLFRLRLLPDLIFILALSSIMTMEAGRNLARDKFYSRMPLP